MAIHQCTAQTGWQGLADLLGKVAAGDEIHLDAGTYHGTATLALPSGVRLIGTEGVILHQDGEGLILTITGSDCELSKISSVGPQETRTACGSPMRSACCYRNACAMGEESQTSLSSLNGHNNSRFSPVQQRDPPTALYSFLPTGQ